MKLCWQLIYHTGVCIMQHKNLQFFVIVFRNYVVLRHLLIHSVSDWSFSSKSSKYHKSQIGRARELKFWENVHPTQHVTCDIWNVMSHMSHVTCHISHVTSHVSHVTCHISCVTWHTFLLLLFFQQSGKAFGEGSVINWGLPCLVVNRPGVAGAALSFII